MNKRCFQHPICFLWEDQEKDYGKKHQSYIPKRNSPIAEILAESEFKCVYDKDKNDADEIYITCSVLEKAFHLGVNLSYTVKDVKNHIKRLEKIPLALIHLFFDEILLKDATTLHECGIRNKSILTMGIRLHTARCEKCRKAPAVSDGEPKKLTLVSVTGDVYEAILSLQKPVEALKELMEAKYKIYPDHQLIIYNGKKLEDDVPLEEYGITGDTNLFLLLYQYDNCNFCLGCAKANEKPTIALNFLNNKVICALYHELTIRKLKETSYQYLHHIHPDLQQIIFKGEELHDSKTLQECGVQNGANLLVKLRFDRRKCDKCNGILS